MTHDFIAAHDVIARYAANQLQAGEERDFEAHLVDCAQCASDVEQELALRDGLAASAADRPTEPVRVAHVHGSSGVHWWQAAAAVFAISTIGLAVWLTSTRSALQVADNARVQQQERADQAARAAQTLEDRVAELESRVAGSATAGSDAPRTFGEGLMPTIVFALTAVRAGGDTIDTFTLDRRVPAAMVVLTVDVPPGDYAVTLKDRDGRIVWNGGQFRPSPQDVMAIGVERRVLADGRYTLEVRGRDASGQSTLSARYPFQISSK